MTTDGDRSRLASSRGGKTRRPRRLSRCHSGACGRGSTAGTILSPQARFTNYGAPGKNEIPRAWGLRRCVDSAVPWFRDQRAVPTLMSPVTHATPLALGGSCSCDLGLNRSPSSLIPASGRKTASIPSRSTGPANLSSIWWGENRGGPRSTRYFLLSCSSFPRSLRCH